MHILRGVYSTCRLRVTVLYIPIMFEMSLFEATTSLPTYKDWHEEHDRL